MKLSTDSSSSSSFFHAQKSVDLDALTESARSQFHPDNIPDELKALKQWVLWQYEDQGNGKVTKPPRQCNGRYARTSDPATWATFDEALTAFRANRLFAGLNLVLKADDPIVAIDIDDYGDTPDPAARDALSWFSSTYAERSPSGGYHVFCFGKSPESGLKRNGKFEVKRALTVTGRRMDGHAEKVTNQQAAIDRYHRDCLNKRTEDIPTNTKKNQAGAPSFVDVGFGTVDYSHRLTLALCNPKIAVLYRGDTSQYGGDRSAAEFALCVRLMTFADGDIDVVSGWMDKSQCAKWLERSKDSDVYRRKTLQEALERWDGKIFVDPREEQRRHGAQVAEALLASAKQQQREPGADDEPANDPQPEPAQPAKRNPDAPQYLSFADLAAMQFPEPSWILPDILPDAGLYLLSGKPKCGKSWLALSLALSVATGGYCLGRKVEQGRVMYLALEDTPRRFMQRMHKIQPDCLINPRVKEALDNGMFTPTFPKLGRGFEAAVEAAIAGNGVRLLIIDTLAKIRPIGGGNANRYDADYGAVGALKDIADRHGICVLVLHHTRKAEADDVHDTVSGTNGIAGAADGSLVLLRQRGGDGSATLAVTGRDLPEAEFGLRFKDGFWDFVGNAEEVKASTEQNAIFNALKGYGGDGATVKMLCATLREEGFGKEQTVRYHLRRMVDAGRVRVRNTKPAPHYAICDGSATPPP